MCARLTWYLNLSTADRTAYRQRTFKAEEELMERLGCRRPHTSVPTLLDEKQSLDPKIGAGRDWRCQEEDAIRA
jgi:hypothetical protein